MHTTAQCLFCCHFTLWLKSRGSWVCVCLCVCESERERQKDCVLSSASAHYQSAFACPKMLSLKKADFWPSLFFGVLTFSIPHPSWMERPVESLRVQQGCSVPRDRAVTLSLFTVNPGRPHIYCKFKALLWLQSVWPPSEAGEVDRSPGNCYLPPAYCLQFAFIECNCHLGPHPCVRSQLEKAWVQQSRGAAAEPQGGNGAALPTLLRRESHFYATV